MHIKRMPKTAHKATGEAERAYYPNKQSKYMHANGSGHSGEGPSSEYKDFKEK